MSANTDADDGIDIHNIEPGEVPVYRPDIDDGPDVTVDVHGAGDAGPMLFQVDVKGHGWYLYALAGVDESGEQDRFAVVADHLNNQHAEAAIEAMGGVVVDE